MNEGLGEDEECSKQGKTVDLTTKCSSYEVGVVKTGGEEAVARQAKPRHRMSVEDEEALYQLLEEKYG